jgi:hypothetical protein
MNELELTIESINLALVNKEDVLHITWRDVAYVHLGKVQDRMPDDAVETVQRFLDGEYDSEMRGEHQ